MQTPIDIEQPEALRAYLVENERVEPGEAVRIEVLRGGVSNRTVRVERAGGEAWVVKQALGKLRVAVDWFSSPTRIEREALGMEWLARLVPSGAITRLVFFDPQNHLLAMDAVPQPHANWRTLLLAGQLDLDHVRQFGQLLGMIHRRAHERRDELEPLFRDRSFFESLRVEPYYAYTASQVASSAPFYDALVQETHATRVTLVHGDYSPKNILVHTNKLILLDHEVIHWGDPAFDLGFSLTHLLSKAHHLPDRRADFANAAKFYWRTYADTLGPREWASTLGPRAVRHTLGCLLARVAGRSPHDYWTPEERERQRRIVPRLMEAPPARVDELVDAFVHALES